MLRKVWEVKCLLFGASVSEGEVIRGCVHIEGEGSRGVVQVLPWDVGDVDFRWRGGLDELEMWSFVLSTRPMSELQGGDTFERRAEAGGERAFVELIASTALRLG